MEIITERFYSNLFRSSTPVSSPIIPTPPPILTFFSHRRSTTDSPFGSTSRYQEHESGGNPRKAFSFTRKLHDRNPDRVEGHRGLPGIPPAPFLTFVDYEKASHSVETNAILSALVDQGASYVRKLANCHDRCTSKTKTQLFHRPLTIPIGKGIRQGDTISSKLFTAALQWIMKSLSWKERGIRVDGRFLSNLLFADDFVLFSSSTNEAETMLNELNEVGKKTELRINRKKTQFMKNAYCEDGVQLEGSQIVETLLYVYFERSVNIENLKEELNRRMRAT
ncbi:hypothetical protein RB195_024349 [Necator americanus]|uniref:Reverse transcriptase domain-containing protein n=1 Tax=Necator americanus TaxID=51031 RepID=A0ABR1ENL7_NECAM